MKSFLKLILCLGFCVLFSGCRSPLRQTQAPAGASFKIITYNVNWGGPRPELAVDLIRESDAEIVCLQETTVEWEEYLRSRLKREYPFAMFRSSAGRAGGGLAFLSKVPATEVAYVPSDTGWFDGWILKFETAVGPVQVLNVHLRPPVSDHGGWVSGYFSTGDDRLREIRRFHAQRLAGVPILVVGDFNDGENSAAISWLGRHGMVNALPQFDRRTPTWEWRQGIVTLRRRMDHIVYSQELDCLDARVIQAGASDHFPVEAVFGPNAEFNRH